MSRARANASGLEGPLRLESLPCYQNNNAGGILGNCEEEHGKWRPKGQENAADQFNQSHVFGVRLRNGLVLDLLTQIVISNRELVMKIIKGLIGQCIHRYFSFIMHLSKLCKSMYIYGLAFIITKNWDSKWTTMLKIMKINASEKQYFYQMTFWTFEPNL